MEDKALNYDLAEEYKREILKIQNKFRQLRSGRIYEFSRASRDGSLATNIDQLSEMFTDLLDKIQFGGEGDRERLAKELNKIKF